MKPPIYLPNSPNLPKHSPQLSYPPLFHTTSLTHTRDTRFQNVYENGFVSQALFTTCRNREASLSEFLIADTVTYETLVNPSRCP